MQVEPNIELSVIIPCWNVAPWLPRCLDEVFAALPLKAEIIAVDDGSDDETPEILARYAANHTELKVYSQSHLGVSAARNRGLDAARGEFIFFVDPDDGIEPEFFELMLRRIKEKNADYCICAFRMRRDDGSFDDTKLKGEYELFSNDEILNGYISRIIGYSFKDVKRFYAKEPLFKRREMASVWRACFKREIIENASVKFDESISLYEDAIFNAEYLLYANAMTCVNRALYRVTERDTSAMKTIPRDTARFARNKLRLLAARIRLNKISRFRLWEFCEASAVFSVLELLSLIVRLKLKWRLGVSVLKDYLKVPEAKEALYKFPLSWRRPEIAVAVGFLRLICKLRVTKR